MKNTKRLSNLSLMPSRSRSQKILEATLGLIGAFLVSAVVILGQMAPDATARGPLDTTSAEYRFAPEADPDVFPGRVTEIWARVYRPSDLSNGPYPLIVFLHGNHATCGYSSDPRIDDSCQYSMTGTCPLNYEVVPNHAGYTYLADRLASWGYVVVSINANRGINCAPGVQGDLGLNLARGRLVLKHLQRLSTWNTTPGTTPLSLGLGADGLLGQLDFANLGLMGHSRGGEGMRAAYNLYRDEGSPWPARIPDPVTFAGIFEIGPVDGQTARVLNADGATWNVLLPMCDGDVSNLQGVRPFDRMLRIFSEDPPRPKSTYTVWGANHNYYNTEWQLSDSSGCFGAGNVPLWSGVMGSPAQRQTGLASVLAFFRGNVGPQADPTFNQNFNPLFELPPVVTSITRVDRGFTDSPNSAITTPIEDFDQPTGVSTYGFLNDASNITITHGSVPNHDPIQRAGVISWLQAGPNTFFQTNWADEGGGRDISGYQTLDLRVSRQADTLNPSTGSTSFSIQLAQANGTLSAPAQLSTYTDLRGPVGGITLSGDPNLHPILQTARIPLVAFAGVDLSNIRGVRLTFDDTPTGAIYVANIRLSIFSGLESSGASETPEAYLSYDYTSPENLTALLNPDVMNLITDIRTVSSAEGLGYRTGVEIELLSSKGFPVRDELPVLRIGGQEFLLSRYTEDGDTHALIFTLTEEAFAKTKTGDEVTLQYGRGESNARWNFGRLDKSLLNK